MQMSIFFKILVPYKINTRNLTAERSIRFLKNLFVQTSSNMPTLGLHGGTPRHATGMSNELGTSPNEVKVLPNSNLNCPTEEKIRIKVALINFISASA